MQDVVHPAVAHIVFPRHGVRTSICGTFLSPALPRSPRGSGCRGRLRPAQGHNRSADRVARRSSWGSCLISGRSADRSGGRAQCNDRGALRFRDGLPRIQGGMGAVAKMRGRRGSRCPETQSLIDRLEEYAVQIDGARALRGSWHDHWPHHWNARRTRRRRYDRLETNLDDFRDFSRNASRGSNSSTAGAIFRRRTAISTTRPICRGARTTRSQRPSTLLDSWMLGRPDLNGQSLPQISYPRPEDVYIDLSVFQTEQIPLIIPVLKPVQILVSHDMLSPPFVFQEEVSIPALPPLPLPDTPPAWSRRFPTWKSVLRSPSPSPMYHSS